MQSRYGELVFGLNSDELAFVVLACLAVRGWAEKFIF